MHPSTLDQHVVIAQFAENRSLTLNPARIVVRIQGRRYGFAKDEELRRAISEAFRDHDALLMDDVFRLVVGMDGERAVKFIQDLLEARAPIYSILHGDALPRLPTHTLHSGLKRWVGQFRKRSEAIRKGLAKNFGHRRSPTRKAAVAGAKARKNLADSRALRLQEEIEKVRSELPERERDNRSAIARALNAAGIAGPGGGKWQGTTVKRIEERVAKLTARH